MNSMQWLLLVALIVCVFWMVGAHNRIVGLAAVIAEAWAQVDALLEQRAQALTALCDALWELWPNGRGAVDSLRSAQTQLQVAAQAVRAQPTRATAAASLAT